MNIYWANKNRHRAQLIENSEKRSWLVYLPQKSTEDNLIIENIV